MKIKKIYIVCLIIIAIFTMGFVSAENNTIAMQSPIEPTHDLETLAESEDAIIEESAQDIGALAESEDVIPEEPSRTNNSNPHNDSKYELDVTLYSLNPIYPWSWIDSDGDSGPGIDIWVTNPHPEYEPIGNTTIYYNGEPIDTIRGIHNYLIEDTVIWNKYVGNGEYDVNVVYSGDEHFNPLNVTDSFLVEAYICAVDNGNVRVTLPIWASGELTVKANGKTYTEKVYDHWDFGPYGMKHMILNWKD